MSKPPRVPTLRDVAGKAGVSSATASYVLHGRRGGADRVSNDTRQLVLAAVAELGYVPNQIARHLRRRRTERVCLVVPRLGSPYWEALAGDLQSGADAHGYSMIVAIAGSLARERMVLDQLRRRLADGVIISPRYADEADLASLPQAGLAVVVIANHLTPQGCDIVRTTESQACHEAMLYLLGKGHRRIAFLGHFSDERRPYERYESYCQALQEHGLFHEDLVRNGADSRNVSYLGTQSLLQGADPPTAIMAASDIAAVSAILAIRDAGKCVPTDVAVIGVGNVPEGLMALPPLTTVGTTSLDFSDVSSLLFTRLADEVPPPGRVVVRQWTVIHRASA